ncbi:MAG TPA: CBS domain-containing protein [Acidimicrobiales bacterium]|nr:CBS domain-containing protein [Acidimicrobiales bacterium]HEV3473471.1 CBS domain-containing protein [Actinomycetota bacterium]
MSVGEILKAKGTTVQTIAGDASVADAVQRLRDESIGALVVSPDGESIEGILSERDVITGLADHGEALLKMKVKEGMTTSVATCSLDDGVEKVMLEMTELRARHFPVLDGDRLVGIVSIGDVVKHRLDEVQLEKNVLRDSYIAGR